MRLDHLYRVRFGYPEGWSVTLRPGGESHHLFLAEGRCEGRVSGRFRGLNHPLRRSDGTYLPDFQGLIDTDDGATVAFDTWGYGRAYPAGARQVVGAFMHVSDDPRYGWLNGALALCTGEVRSTPEGAELVLDVAELVWERPSDDAGVRP